MVRSGFGPGSTIKLVASIGELHLSGEGRRAATLIDGIHKMIQAAKQSAAARARGAQERDA